MSFGQSEQTVPKKTLFGYSRDSVEYGSPAYQRHINDLMNAITEGQYDFMTYKDDIDFVLNPDETKDSIDANNRMYCQYMLHCCLDPLTHGLDKDSILTATGMYLGMALVSQDFRDEVDRSVHQALLPFMEKKVRMGAKVSDFFDNYKNNAKTALESIVGHKFGEYENIVDDSQMSSEERVDREIQNLRDRVARESDLHGRLPLTPESAATQYLNFGVSAYNKMREPGADCAEISAAYNEAVTTLKEVALSDCISEEQLMRNVMAVYGKVAEAHPEICRCFEETAYSDLRRGAGEKEVGPDGKTRTVWRNSFENTGFDGNLSPRAPMNPTQHKERLSEFMAEAMVDCDSFQALGRTLNSDRQQRLNDYWMDMVNEDLSNCPKDGWNKSDNPNDPDFYNKMCKSAFTDAGNKWLEKMQASGKKMKDEEEFVKRAKARNKRGRDTSGIPDYGVPNDDPQYY